MDQDKTILRAAMLKEFTQAADARLQEVALGDPDATIMAELLASLPAVTLQSSIRYLAPGRSGAKVVVVNSPQQLPRVVKFGLKTDIQREHKNYIESQVEERLAQEIRPALHHSAFSDKYGALVYSWAGSWKQVKSFREFFAAARVEELEHLVVSLMQGLFPWHNVRKSSKLPFDRWKWDGSILSQILDSIQRSQVSTESKRILTAVLQNQNEWRDSLITKHGSVGTCHGDLNCHNVLVTNETGLPKLIDFASVLLADCPARDYAKLERDIKLRCLRNLIGDPAGFVRTLELVDGLTSNVQIVTTTNDPLAKTIKLVRTLRSSFCEHSANLSDIPLIEYLYFLFCWTLAYLTNHDGVNESPAVRDAIINSAARTLEVLEEEIRRVNDFSARDSKRQYSRLTSRQPDWLQLQLESYIDEKARGFMGREFVFLDLERFLRENDRGYFVVEGEPGIGKTSLSAHLVKAQKLTGTTMIYHFNDELSGIVQPEQFANNVCSQLAEKFRVEELNLKHLLENISSRLSKDERLLVVVDALDEAQITEGAPNRLDLPVVLPKGIYFFVTTRALTKQSLIVESPRKDFPLISNSLQNLADIRRYVESVINQGPLLKQLRDKGYEVEDFVNKLQSKSEGNFMYLYHILPELERGDLEFHNLPQGLQGYYERHWQKMKSRDLEAWIKYQMPVIKVLAALPEFLTSSDIAEVTHGLSPAQITAVLSEWRPFLRQQTHDHERRYRLYHLTFQEFLSSKEDVGELDLSKTRDTIIEKLKEVLRPLREGINN
jgi:hypothetical protein